MQGIRWSSIGTYHQAATVATFEEYGEDAFLAFIQRELAKGKRIDVVCDQYLDSRIKCFTSEKRGSGARRKVSPQTKIPSKCLDFLRVAENKVELFAFQMMLLPNLHCQSIRKYT